MNKKGKTRRHIGHHEVYQHSQNGIYRSEGKGVEKIFEKIWLTISQSEWKAFISIWEAEQTERSMDSKRYRPWDLLYSIASIVNNCVFKHFLRGQSLYCVLNVK